jgi:hypothetical protein
LRLPARIRRGSLRVDRAIERGPAGSERMINVYLFIELLRAAKAADVAAQLKALDLGECRFANVVVLAEDKLVAQLDCESNTAANTAILEKISPIEGIVQTNVIAAVRPVHK